RWVNFKSTLVGHFYIGADTAYKAAIKNGWMEEICSHLEYKKKRNGYWTLERCMTVAQKYTTKVSFKEGAPEAYTATYKHNWQNIVCSHMTSENGKWTKKTCSEVAMMHTTRDSFIKYASGAYQAARRQGFLDEICSHMTSKPRFPPNHWNCIDTCRKEALKYQTRSEFQRGSPGAYKRAHRNGWLDDILSHTDIVGNKEFRCIYFIYSPLKNEGYVGLTANYNKRISAHKRGETKSTRDLVQEPDVSFEQITPYIPSLEASTKEAELEEYYSSKGISMLNYKSALGGLGGEKEPLTKEQCADFALSYSHRVDFMKGKASAYHRARVKGWLDDICKHMAPSRLQYPKGYWDQIENCRKEALKYSSRASFMRGSRSAYNASIKPYNDWLDEVCSHMPPPKETQTRTSWTKESCIREAQKYKTRSEFRKHCHTGFNAANDNGWLDHCCAHMQKANATSYGYWTKENCHDEAMKYERRNEFRIFSRGAYKAAWKNGWLDDICSHMKKRGE
ncbi:GIY-YIG nuclease family protein, partial [Vibrio sp. 10N.247.310.17]|uniref:GIY-YIG nuclease family protein n=1 Tax=Vibrio sp. 10N.247.310.17 TaxID=3229979 RepID=UPI00354B66A6